MKLLVDHAEAAIHILDSFVRQGVAHHIGEAVPGRFQSPSPLGIKRALSHLKRRLRRLANQ